MTAQNPPIQPATPEREPERPGAERSSIDTAREFLRENERSLIPGPGSSDADWSAFYGRLGRPETAAGYDLGAVEISGEVAALVNEPLRQKFIALAHTEGLTQRQLTGLLTNYYSLIDESMHARADLDEQAGAATEASLRAELGGGFDVFLGRAQGALLRLAGGDAKLAERIAMARMEDGTLVGDSAAVLKALAAIEAAPASPAHPAAPAPAPAADATDPAPLVRRILASTGRDSSDAYRELSKFIDRKIGG
jgi:hypothetical protein